MPNLTSVERLTRFYESDKNVFAVLMVAYDIEQTRVEVERVTFVPIEFLGWDCLTIGALGWGQIQIAIAKHVKVDIITWVAGHRPALVFRNLETTTLLYLAITLIR
ncbi:hypothetical protein GlitD10_1901 [Gloeomargarita lithophora Alchichica-D10]|uniref:Uncharacterized protein n=1 Tax=Gloeomargarita lithophora Alchichica-D10 TaxID=1188229 RepID=A0A1J0AEA4_9CYAN|nr:hypothetical protein GlitD10_1901 [Gloeomargarita lithophora Alchichica-D10]